MDNDYNSLWTIKEPHNEAVKTYRTVLSIIRITSKMWRFHSIRARTNKKELTFRRNISINDHKRAIDILLWKRRRRQLK